MTKRIISVLLALVLVLALAMPAMAEVTYQEYELKIKDDADRTYNAYQIFKGNQAFGSEDSLPTFTDIAWGDGVDSAKLLAKLGLSSDATAADAVAAIKALQGGGKEAAYKIADCLNEEKAIALTGNVGETVQSGYYFVKETTTGKDTTSAFVLNVLDGVVVNPKRSDVPEYDKTMYPEEPTNVSDNYIGDVIPFEIEVTIPANYDKYDYYELTMKDTMDKGLTYNGDAKVSGINGTVVKSEEGEKTVLTLKTGDISDVSGLAGVTVKISYTATLNKDAVIGTPGNFNQYEVAYDTTPETNDEKWTKPLYTVVFTFELDGNKYTGADKDAEAGKLAGAKFVLKNADGKYLKVVDGKITWVATEAEADKLVSDDKGYFGVKGLDAGNYQLIETEAPAGYNKLTSPTAVVIDPDYNETTNKTLKVTISETHELVDGIKEVDVLNQAGTTLPETGGIGTTIFYLVGGLMMAAAVVLLVAKKRTVNE